MHAKPLPGTLEPEATDRETGPSPKLDPIRAKRVIDLIEERPEPGEFLARIDRALEMRFYSPRAIHAYRGALAGFLQWGALPPHQVTEEDVRNYLAFLIDGGVSYGRVSLTLAAIRAAFDRLCGSPITDGIEVPRRTERSPHVLSPWEVLKLLKAAPSLRDKLLLALLYGTGLGAGEVLHLRWGDLDRIRLELRPPQGRGQKHAGTLLPASLRPLIDAVADQGESKARMFGAADSSRHLSQRMVQRILHRAISIARIEKRASAHTLFKSFAAHVFEKGEGVEFVHQLLSTARLDKVTLYTKLDRHAHTPAAASRTSATDRFRVRIGPIDRSSGIARSEAVAQVLAQAQSIALGGIVVRAPRPGWVTIDLPPEEVWPEPLRRETPADPAFFHQLQAEIVDRFVEALAAESTEINVA